MPISKETLKAMIRDFHGFELSDAERDLIAPELDAYLSEVEKIRDLDLSGIMSSRLIKANRMDQGRFWLPLAVITMVILFPTN